jgi:hypothetical protein
MNELWTGKLKIVPVHAMKAYMGVVVQLHALLTTALQGEF